MGIALAYGVPIYDSVEFNAFVASLDLVAGWHHVFPAAGIEVSKFIRLPCKAQPVHVTREVIARAALAEQCDVLVFQDSDVSPESPEDVALLVRTLLDRPDAALVGAPCPIQAFDGAIVHNVWPLRAEDGTPLGVFHDRPFEVSAMGFGLVALRLDVFRSMDPPWFTFDSDKVGEDVGWCDRVRHKLGRTVWCDPRIRPRHSFRRSFRLGDEASLAGFLSQAHHRAKD